MYKTYGVYAIRNKKTGMVYVGQTINNFGDRRDHHFTLLRANKHSNKPLQEAQNQDGDENFEFVVVYLCEHNETKEELNNLEIHFIKYYKEAGLAYNIADGGDAPIWTGKHLTDEMKKKIGEANRINMTGRKLSDDTKKKMSDSQKARYANMSEEEKVLWGRKMSECAFGYSWSDEAKQKFAEKQRLNPNGAKYTVEQVRYMRYLHETEGKGATEIGKMLNIPAGTVHSIITYKRWANID